ncbi:MAG: hypothetical protein A2176_15975 [Spirochaetes bacterium RBG_13_51_14]|nr:MAG: hypothetical protein A2176_15975 [Spirochaetes bacterium RBG_13_51_14]
MRDLKPEDFKKPKSPEPDAYIPPRYWNNFVIKGKKLDGIGYATYRLHVLGDRKNRELALRIRDVYMAYTIFAGGERIGAAGRFGTDEASEIPQYLPQVVDFPTAAHEYDIIMNVSNFHHFRGGMPNQILLGNERDIRGMREIKLFSEILFFGGIILMGLYHLFLFAIRKKDRSPLYLGIFCVVISLFTLITGERYLIYLFPDTSWNVFALFIALCYFFSMIVFSMYWNSLYPDEFPKIILRVFQVIGTVFIIIAIVTPPRIFLYSTLIFDVMIIAGCVYVIYVLIIAAVKKREGPLIFLAGFIILSIFIVNDILYDIGIIKTGQLFSMGIFLFLFFQSIALSMRSGRSFAAIENLSRELKSKTDELAELNLSLERKVQERTKDLDKAQGELKTLLSVFSEMNDNLFDVNRELEYAQKTMQQDMEMAGSVQAQFFSKIPPTVEGWDLAFALKPIAIVSGDLYDFYMTGDRLAGASLFDVSGHGVASGLITMLAKSISYRQFMHNPAANLNHVLRMINEELIQEVGNLGNYISGIMLRFTDGRVDYVNAGHPDIIIKRSDTGRAEIVGKGSRDFKGMFLGFSFFTRPYGMLTFEMKQGDALVMYTDSLVESINGEERQYGIRKLLNCCESAFADATATELLDFIMNDFKTFIGETPQMDDLTVIIIKKL